MLQSPATMVVRFTGRNSAPGALGILMSLLLCSCTTESPVHPQRPAAVAMNQDAGRGSWRGGEGLLIVTVRLEDGESLPFLVDTGSPITTLDSSLESKLGARLGTGTISNFGVEREAHVYRAPNLYLGGTRLMTGGNVCTIDLKPLNSRTGHHFMGILGMDSLRHYCIQLDFKAGRMRFLDPNHLKAETLGKVFPIGFSSEGQSVAGFLRPYIHCPSLLGGESIDVQIDTGCNVDGGAGPGLFGRKVEEQNLKAEAGTPKGPKTKKATFPACMWEGGVYTNITIRTWPTDAEVHNLIGLSFLARHLVTLNFPGRTLYLKQESIGPLIDEDLNRARQAAKDAALKSGLKALTSLRKQNQLPGYGKEENGQVFLFHFQLNVNAGPESLTFECRKSGRPFIYHYQFTRAVKGEPWRLERAWRTDQDYRKLEEFPVP